MKNNRFKIKTAPLVEIISGAILVVLGTGILSNNWVDNIFLSFISFWKGRPPAAHWLGNLHIIGIVLLVSGYILVGLFIIPYWDRFLKTRHVLHLAQKWNRSKQRKGFGTITSVITVTIIWILITVEEFSFSFMGNETDVLPSIRQFVDHAWLPNDWYLNINTSYRTLFDFIFGHLVTTLGFVNGAYVGRIIEYFLLAIAIYLFIKTVNLRPMYGLLVLLIFLNFQSLVAGEWIVYSLETKTVAYAMVLFSFSFFLRKRYLWGFVFAGAAISFHVLVGIFAIFCLVVASIFNKSWRTEWRLYIKNIWTFFISGVFGLWAVIEQLLPLRGIDTAKAWDIYVYYRVPQHVLPIWHTVPWKTELAVALVLLLIVYLLTKSNVIRFVAAFTLGSVLLFLTGLGIYASSETQLLRFYWFRFPDVVLPFMGAVLIALLLNNFSGKPIILKSLKQRFQYELQKTIRLVPPLIFAFLIVMTAQQINRLTTSYQDSLINDSGTILPAFAWISNNTPKSAVFLVDPTEADFYIYAQRAMFVSWKSSPQSAAAILEWYKRILLINENLDLVKGNSGNSAQEIHTNYYKLDETQIQQIADIYGINYYMGLADQKLTFKCVYSDSIYAVYAIK